MTCLINYFHIYLTTPAKPKHLCFVCQLSGYSVFLFCPMRVIMRIFFRLINSLFAQTDHKQLAYVYQMNNSNISWKLQQNHRLNTMMRKLKFEAKLLFWVSSRRFALLLIFLGIAEEYVIKIYIQSWLILKIFHVMDN